MLYASELFRTRGCGKVGLEDSPDELPDLVAEVLAHAVERRLHRNLSLGYRSRHSVLSRVRGRIDVLTTERHQLLLRGRVACRYDELTIDTPRNRYVLGALRAVSRLVRRSDLLRRCTTLANALSARGVGAEVPSRAQIQGERFGRHDADDRLMVAAAHVAFELCLPSEDAGRVAMSRPDREEVWARHLYERAVGGFYAVVLADRGWRVQRGKWIYWDRQHETAGIDALLPAMQTDIVLERSDGSRRVVIDTKFTSIVTSGRHGSESFRSPNIYQLYAYLRSQCSDGDPLADRAEGLLLYPAISTHIDESVIIQGHKIRFATVDLGASNAAIRERLLAIIEG